MLLYSKRRIGDERGEVVTGSIVNHQQHPAGRRLDTLAAQVSITVLVLYVLTGSPSAAATGVVRCIFCGPEGRPMLSERRGDVIGVWDGFPVYSRSRVALLESARWFLSKKDANIQTCKHDPRTREKFGAISPSTGLVNVREKGGE